MFERIPPVPDRRALVSRAAQGDHDAFAELAGAAYQRLYGIARLTLGDPELAEDAVQEALIKAWRDLPMLREPDAWEGWLHRILIRSCITHARERGRWRARVDFLEADAVAPGSGATLLVESRDALRQAFAALSLDHRAVVILHHYLDLSVDEIGAALGIPGGTVKSRLHYALRSMRATLDADARDAEERGR